MSLTISATISDNSGASAVVKATAFQSSAGDGSANAPSGTAQFPLLLNSYTAPKVRPPWNVAGVDYRVGIDRAKFATNAALKNPASISVAGVSVSGHQVLVTGANVTLDGYDFSLNGGYGVYSTGNNLTISNSNFLIGPALQLPIRQDGNGLTVLNTEIDGNHQQNAGGNVTHVQMGGSGPLVIEYCLFQRAFGDFIDLQTGGSIDLHFNVWKDLGDINAHPDVLQIEGSNYGPCSVTYNLSLYTDAAVGPQTYGFTAISGGYLDIEIGNNTIISQASGPATAMGPSVINVDMTKVLAGHTVRIYDNYCDPTGVDTNFFFADPAGANIPSGWRYPQGKVWNTFNMLNGTHDQGIFGGTGP